jgi:outer membrane receptor protein involved in Fe transport
VDGGTQAPQLTGLRPAQAPIWSLSAGADWQASDRLNLSLRARYESRRFEDDLNSRVLEEGLTFDTRAEWRVNRSTQFWLSAENLFDVEVDVGVTGTGVASYGPPRTVSAGLRFSL